MKQVLVGVILVTIAAAGVWSLIARRSTATANASDQRPALATARVSFTDLIATDLVDGNLGFGAAPAIVNRLPGTFTALPPSGTIVNADQMLFEIDDKPVVLFIGDRPSWRDMGLGVSDGDDIAQLQANLVNLGFRTRTDGHFDAGTVNAVQRWQRSHGLDATGTIELGRVLFAPSPIRVGQTHSLVGASAQPDAPVFDVISDQRVVDVPLSAARQADVALGQTVTVHVSGRTPTPGVISAIDHVATAPPASASPDVPTTALQTTDPTINVLVTLQDQAAADGLDAAPVQVEFTTQRRDHVLAVPIAALLAAPDGTYTLEVVENNGVHRSVPVSTGLYASTLVELTGGDVVDGTTVVVAR